MPIGNHRSVTINNRDKVNKYFQEAQWALMPVEGPLKASTNGEAIMAELKVV